MSVNIFKMFDYTRLRKIEHHESKYCRTGNRRKIRIMGRTDGKIVFHCNGEDRSSK